MIMFVEKECFNLCDNSVRAYFRFEQATECPRCHCGIVAQDIKPVVYDCSRGRFVTVLNFCPRCQSCFITTYQIISYERCGKLIYTPDHLIASEPPTPNAIIFSPLLTEISSDFVEIYNQAYQAEIYSLSHIAGMGYRKALEFLIKDYAIHFNPTEAETIKEQALAQCIKTYIDNPKIKTLAERSAWLGNDEVHYVRKHPDFDINDLKRFIDTCVDYIEMELNLEQCNSIQKA